MARDKNTSQTQEEKDQQSSAVVEALDKLTDKQAKFLELMDSGKYTQVEAYREAFDTQTDNNRTVAVNASKLWNSTDFLLIRSAVAQTVMKRSARSLEERIARMEQLRQIAIDTGNIGAAVQAEEKLGKLEGHYIDRSETRSTHLDYAETLKELKGHIPDEQLEAFKGKLGIAYEEETTH